MSIVYHFTRSLVYYMTIIIFIIMLQQRISSLFCKDILFLFTIYLCSYLGIFILSIFIISGIGLCKNLCKNSQLERMIMTKKNGNDMLTNYTNICHRSAIYSNYSIDYYNKTLIHIDALLFYFIITLMNTLLATNSSKGRPRMNRKSRPLVRFGSCYLSIMSSKLNGTVKIHFFNVSVGQRSQKIEQKYSLKT